MLIAVISDIHGNWPAFRTVLKDIDGRGVEAIISCGDVLGYHPFIEETVSAFRKRKIPTVMGNHDYAIANDNYSGMNGLVLKTDPWIRKRMTPESLEWLKGLPLKLETTADGKRLAVHHGSPYNIEQYVMREEAKDSPFMLEDAFADILLLGHTHHPMAVKAGSGLILNPGSVGQPRDSDPRASYGLLDAGKGEFTIVRLAYDIGEVKAKVKEAGLPDYLWERLQNGD